MISTKVIKIRHIYLTLVSAFLFTLNSCSDEPRNDYSLSDIPEQTSVARFDKDFFAMDPQNLPNDLAKLAGKYPEFYDFYTQELMKWPDSLIAYNSRILLTHPTVKDLRDTINMVFGDFSDESEILQTAFKRFHHHFPELKVPKIITAFAEFSYPTATDQNLLILCLELYLGEDYPYYPGLGLPEFKIRRMNKHYLPKFAMEAWYDQQFGDIPIGNRFLDHMIAEGKKLYYMDLMLPELADTLRNGWTKDQMAWLENNEFQMWTYYIDQQYLYNTDFQAFGDLLIDAPFTAAANVPPESAPRIGAYSGYQIIKKFMKENPEVSLGDLMANVNADLILKESGYRP